MLAVIVGLPALGIAGLPRDSVPAHHGASEAMVVLESGDTVWDVALAYRPAGADPHQWVARVVALNGIDPGRVQPGTAIRVPLP